MSDIEPTVILLQERINFLEKTFEQKLGFQDEKIEKIEDLIRAEFEALSDSIEKLSEKLENVSAWMDRSKGWAAASLLFVGIISGLAAKFLADKLK